MPIIPLRFTAVTLQHTIIYRLGLALLRSAFANPSAYQSMDIYLPAMLSSLGKPLCMVQVVGFLQETQVF